MCFGSGGSRGGTGEGNGAWEMTEFGHADKI